MRFRPRISGKISPRRVALRVVVFLTLQPVLLYLVLFAMEAYSAHQASVALTQLENLRLGDPASSYDRTVSAFKTEAGVYVLNAGAFRLERLWDWMWTSGPDRAEKLYYFASRAGLRWWRLTTSAAAENGKLTRVSAGFMVVGHYEMLGTGWNLEASHDLSLGTGRTPTDADRRTFLHWTAITSMPSGEGLIIEVTPESASTELAARHINRKCLLTMHGCDGLCELLPRAAKVLRERGTGWGGYTSAPPSPCKNED